jgi:hypothetical protein
MNPFQYFDGGEEGVISRFLVLIQKSAAEIPEKYRQEIIQDGELPFDFFERIAAGDRSVVTGEAVEALQIEISQGLGVLQNFGPEEQQKWENEAEGFCSVSGGMEEETRIKIFVILKAIEKLGKQVS